MWTAVRSTPVYEATASVFIGPRAPSKSAVSGQGELGFFAISAQEYVTSFAQQIQGRQMAEQVVEQLRLDILPSDLADRVSTQIRPETRIIDVTFRDTDRVRAAVVANALVDVFASAQRRQGAVSGLQATPFEEALLPDSPVSPRPIRDGVIGLFLGALVGVGGAVGMEQMDTRLRNREDVEVAVAPAKVLAEIPAGPKGGDQRKLWIRAEPGSHAAEAFRILRTNLQFLAVERRIQSMLVTSPSPQEGKTTVAANLASSFAAGGYRTLLVDADLRHPTVQHYFGLDHEKGLSDVLAGTLELSKAVTQTELRNLWVITAGRLPPNPSELFGSQRMVSIIEQLEEGFDIVVFDAPPAMLVADAPALSSHLDGVIFVSRAGVTTRDQARDALRRFALLDVRILGAVLNASRRIRADRYYGYAYRAYYRGEVTADQQGEEDEVLPAQVRLGRRDEDGTRSIESILADLETLSNRRQRRPADVAGGVERSNGSHAPEPAPAEQVPPGGDILPSFGETAEGHP